MRVGPFFFLAFAASALMGWAVSRAIPGYGALWVSIPLGIALGVWAAKLDYEYNKQRR